MDSTKKFAVLRIVFGAIWAVDAFFKWHPDFLANFTGYLEEGAEGQPLLIQGWVHLWLGFVGANPHFFAFLAAAIETAIAIGLILGIFTRVICYGGIVFSLVIWSTAEGFGGPYAAGSTDVGAAIIYALVFSALIIGECWKVWSIDALRNRQNKSY